MEKPSDSHTESSEVAQPQSSETSRRWPARAINFLQSWRERQSSEQETKKAVEIDDDKEEDDDDTETSGTSWLSRLGRALLKNQGIKQPETKAAKEDEPELPKYPEPPEIPVAAPKPTSEYEPDDSLVSLPEELTEYEELSDEHSEPEVSEDSKDELNRLEKTSTPEPELEPEPEIEPLTEEEPLPSSLPTTVYERETGLIRPTEPEIVAEPTSEPAIGHRHGEPLAAAGMALGAAEHHRVTKLKRRTETLEEEHKETTKENDGLRDKYEQLERQMRQVANKMSVATEKQPEKAASSSKTVEAKPGKPVEMARIERKAEPTIVFERQNHNSPLERPRLKPESALSPLEKQPMTKIKEQAAPEMIPETLDDNFRERPIKSSPEAVLKQVEKAAEENIAIEALYERRQEVKDDPAYTTDYATGIGTSQMPLPQGQLLNPSQSTSGPIGNYHVPVPDSVANLWESQPPIYRKAMATSAAAAVLVLVAVGLIMLILG